MRAVCSFVNDQDKPDSLGGKEEVVVMSTVVSTVVSTVMSTVVSQMVSKGIGGGRQKSSERLILQSIHYVKLLPIQNFHRARKVARRTYVLGIF